MSAVTRPVVRSRAAALVAAVAVAAGLLVAPPPAMAQGNFTDHGDIASVHHAGVYALMSEGVVQGCGDGSEYCPADGVTREQMASFIGRALGLPRDAAPRFDDVEPTSTHGGYVGALSQAGITQGCDDEGNYCPRDTVTREQMASFIQRAYQLVGTGAPTFEDLPSGGGTHGAGIAGVAASQVTLGCTETEFCPRDTVTREQMASFIARAMGLLRNSRGCPTTAGPEQLSTGAPALTSFGAAAQGFPVNSAELVGNRLHAFSLDLTPSRMFVYDAPSQNGVRTVNVPNGRRTWAVHSPTQGSNTHMLYFGQDAPSNNLYQYNTSNNQLSQIGSITGISEMWDMTSDDQGRIYIGTSAHNTIYRFTPSAPANQRLQRLTFTGGTGQVTQLDWADGVLYVGTGRGTARLMTVDTAGWNPGSSATAYAISGISGFGVYSLEVTDDVVAAGLENPSRVALYDRPDPTVPLNAQAVAATLSLRGGSLIAPPQGEGAFTAIAADPGATDGTGVGSAIYTAGRTEGTIYRVAPGATSLTELFEAPPAPLSPTRAMFVHNGQVIGVAAPATVWTSTLGSNTYTINNLVNAGAPSEPTRPQSLAAGSGHIAVGSNNSLTLHREQGAPTTLPVPGEPKVMQAVGSQLFVGLYPTATLRRITLSGAYASATVQTWNETYGRPTDVTYESGGSGRLQISAQVTSNSGAPGSLVRFEGNPPALVSQYVQPSNERGASAVTTSGNRTIIGGTAATGGSARVVSRPTSATSGSNPQWTATPVPGGGNITGLTTIGNRVHGMAQNGTWFTINPSNGEVTQTRRVFDGTAGRMVSRGNWLYAVTRDCLVAIDTQRDRVETLHSSLAANTFGPHTVTVDPGSSSGVADTYAIRGNDLIRVRHQQR